MDNGYKIIAKIRYWRSKLIGVGILLIGILLLTVYIFIMVVGMPAETPLIQVILLLVILPFGSFIGVLELAEPYLHTKYSAFEEEAKKEWEGKNEIFVLTFQQADIYCPYCSTKLEPMQKICHYCGRVVKSKLEENEYNKQRLFPENNP